MTGYFACQDMGTHSLKGVSDPVQVYRVLEESAVQSRLEVVGRTGLAPLVGRDSEMTLLLERWTQSKDGLGQVVLLVGEAGIGKSRLIAALHEYVTGKGSPNITLRCSSYHMHSALYPVIPPAFRKPAVRGRRPSQPLQRHPTPS
jgi:transcriptional regulator with AAA-type ATPase domain